jgi:hypothetical protein
MAYFVLLLLTLGHVRWCTLQSEPSPTTGTFSLSSFYNGAAMRMPSGNSKDGNVGDQGSQGFVFKPLGVKTVSRNNISTLANVVACSSLNIASCVFFLLLCWDIARSCSLHF